MLKLSVIKTISILNNTTLKRVLKTSLPAKNYKYNSFERVPELTVCSFSINSLAKLEKPAIKRQSQLWAGG